MKRENKIILVFILIFFLFSLYVYREYEELKGEKYVPHRYKALDYEKPMNTAAGLFFLDGYLWISSPDKDALLKYDLATETVLETHDVPCFETAGLTYDGENFWVADYSKRTLYVISPGGEVVASYTTPYSTPYGLAWDGENLWVLDVFGLEEYPDLFTNVYPNAIIYEYDPENDVILDLFDAPVSFSGDIAYKDGELIVTGCTSRKIFHVDIGTKKNTEWQYAPDTIPRAVAIGENDVLFVAGMSTNNLWEIDMAQRAQYKDIRRERDVIVPFWLIIITSLLILPVFLDELTRKINVKKGSFVENVYIFVISNEIIVFLLKTSIIALIIYYISDYFLLREITASAIDRFLEPFGIFVTSYTFGTYVFLDGFIVTKSCLSMIFLALVIGMIGATNIDLKKKLLFSLLAFIILFIWNIIRLSILIVLTRNNVPYLFAHDFFFYVGGIAMVLVILKICGVISLEAKENFSSIGERVKERIIKGYLNRT
jgi:exosortase/archaeosortase family protein